MYAWRHGPGMGRGEMADKEPPPEPPGDEQVWRWRYRQLVKRGVPVEDAERLAEQRDVVHEIDRLLEKGCPPDRAALIVL